MRVVLVMLSCLALLGQSLSPSGSLTDQDRARLRDIFAQGLSQDIGSVHYAVLGYGLLGDQLTSLPDKERLCALAAEQADDSGLEVVFAAAGTGEALRCPVKLGAKAAEVIKTNLAEGSSPASIYFAAKAQVATGGKLDAAAVKAALLGAIKKDDSLLSLGLAFHVAAMLDGDLAAFVDRLEDALVQADEVDGRMLQFEGGLSVTSVVLTGAAALAQKAKKPLPLTGEQMVKFANYLVSRRSVQQVKGAVHLLEAVEVMVNNGQAIPLVVALQGARSAAISRDNPVLTVAVTDLKGGNPGDLKVVLDSATLSAGGKVVGSNLALKKVEGSAASLYSLDLMNLNPPAGFYELKLTATPNKGASKFVGNSGVVLRAKVLTTITLKHVKLQILDADQTTSGRSFDLSYPAKLGQQPAVDYKERIQLTFAVVNTEGENVLLHQAFVRMMHKATKSEIIYIAEADSSRLYKFDLDLGAQLDEFKYKSGEYELTLLLGDALTTNSLEWTAAELVLTFPESEAAKNEAGLYEPKPEISHLFREPEARPSKLVSNAFTLLVLSPLLLLLISWLRLGVNISNFPYSLSGLGFHVGLGAIFMLYLYFWLQLNMFETVKYLVVIGVVTFLCGNSLLATIAKKNK